MSVCVIEMIEMIKCVCKEFRLFLQQSSFKINKCNLTIYMLFMLFMQLMLH